MPKVRNVVEFGVGRTKTQRAASTMNKPAGELPLRNALRGKHNAITLSRSSAEHTITIADVYMWSRHNRTFSAASSIIKSIEAVGRRILPTVASTFRTFSTRQISPHHTTVSINCDKNLRITQPFRFPGRQRSTALTNLH